MDKTISLFLIECCAGSTMERTPSCFPGNKVLPRNDRGLPFFAEHWTVLVTIL
jgi:hypothetical protein